MHIEPTKTVLRLTRKRWVATVVIMTAFLSLPVAAEAGLTAKDLKARIEKLRTSLTSIAGKVEHAEEALEGAELELARHRAAVKRSAATRARVKRAISERAALLYKTGGIRSNVEMLLSSEDVGDALNRNAYLSRIRYGEQALLEETLSLRHHAAEQQKRLTASIAKSKKARAALSTRQSELNRKLREYKMLQRFLEMTAGRNVARASRFGPGGMVCPVAGGTAFRNGWGDPRPGGPHTGIDMRASHGQRVVAVLPGKIVDTPGGGWIGIGIIMRDLAGNEYWYAHLSSRNVHVGQRVVPGEVIGRVGCTGRCYGPHLHFEYHPGGGGAVNPYRILRASC